MLRKLIKHDLIYTSRILIPTHFILAFITIVGILILKSGVFKEDSMELLSIILVSFYIISLVGFSFAIILFLMIHFYRSLFTKQGYLSFTLPVSPWMLLHSKMIVGVFWYTINTTLTFLSIYILLVVSGGLKFIHKFLFEFSSLFTDESILTKQTFFEFVGIRPEQLIIYLILFFVIITVNSLIMIFFCIVVGQLFEKHKISAAIITYIVIFFIHQVISSIALIGNSIFNNMVRADGAVLIEMAFDFYASLFTTMMITSLFMSIAFYVATGVIMNKRINLD